MKIFLGNTALCLCIYLLILGSGCLGTETASPTASNSVVSPSPSPSPDTPVPESPGPIEENVKVDMSEEQLDLDEANVIDVKISGDSTGGFTFSVTVLHNDTGWDHYADWWRIKTPEGEEIARRVLAHPHENEMPFTRSLGGVIIPADVDIVIVEAHDNVHGYGGTTVEIDLVTGSMKVLNP